MVSLKALLHCANFSATCLARVENLALQVAEIWCWGPVTLRNFLSNLSRNASRNEKQEVCACALVKTAVKLRDKLLEGWYTVQWCCQLLQSVAKSRTEFYFVQRFAQQNNCETTHVTLCNSPATCLSMPLQDKLLRKVHSVTGPLVNVLCWYIVSLKVNPSITSLRRLFEYRVIEARNCFFLFTKCLFCSQMKPEKPVYTVICILYYIMAHLHLQKHCIPVNNLFHTEKLLVKECHFLGCLSLHKILFKYLFTVYKLCIFLA